MKKILTIIFIFLNISTSQAYIQGCGTMESEMNNYTEYKTKIDNIFEIISQKDVNVQEKIYKNLQTKLSI